MAKGRRLRLLVSFLVAPLLIVSMVFAEKLAPRVFGAAWYGRHGEQFMTGYGIFVFLGIVASVALPNAGSLLAMVGGGPAERRIRRTGRPARATVLAVGEQAGGGFAAVNGQPYLNLAVRVEDGVNPPYETDFDTLIPRALATQACLGGVVNVKIDPGNPRRVVLDY